MNKYIALKLWLHVTMEKLRYCGKNYGTIEKKDTLPKTLIYYGKNYGTMEKTMVLWWKLWYSKKNYDTLPKTIELWFTIEKTMVLWKNYGYYSKNMEKILNITYLVFFFIQNFIWLCPWQKGTYGNSLRFSYFKKEFDKTKSEEVNSELFSLYSSSCSVFLHFLKWFFNIHSSLDVMKHLS